MEYQVIVIGGSFAGVSAALQLARARCRVLLVDAGLPRNRFARSAHGFLGQDGKSPREIIGEATRQLALYPTVSFCEGEAIGAFETEGGFVVTLSDGRSVSGLRLILATGMRDELPSIAGIQERWGITVLHCPYCHGYEVSGRALGVVANLDHSPHQALLVSEWGPTVYFSQGVFAPNEEDAAKFVARGIQIERTPVVALLGEAPGLEAVRLEDGRVVPIDAIFTAPKSYLVGTLAEQLGCALTEGPMGTYIEVNDWKQTSVSGVYAAGDAANLMPNASFASAAGVMAGVAAHQSLVFAGG